MTPTVGRIVHYKLSEWDVAAINRRRADYQNTLRAGEGNATGYVAHVGNDVRAGDDYPAIVVRCWFTDYTPESCVNLQVLLDGNDSYWATSRRQGDENGQWRWPERVA